MAATEKIRNASVAEVHPLIQEMVAFATKMKAAFDADPSLRLRFSFVLSGVMLKGSEQEQHCAIIQGIGAGEIMETAFEQLLNNSQFEQTMLSAVSEHLAEREVEDSLMGSDVDFEIRDAATGQVITDPDIVDRVLGQIFSQPKEKGDPNVN